MVLLSKNIRCNTKIGKNRSGIKNPDFGDSATEKLFVKIESIKEKGPIQSLTVKQSDLDVNGHVNNVKCVDYIMNGFPPGFHKSHTLGELSIHYMNEALYLDKINLFLD
ncbi:hypothetical protein GF407_02010 [candidate division KSB1 bacterium]|nr:hypothetical protein [candidate division KSB1 bacterium]